MKRLALAAALAAACNYHRVAVPLATPEARSCAETCEAARARHRNWDAYRTCLASCPGAVAGPGQCGDSSSERCAQRTSLKPAAAVVVGVAIIAVVIGGVLAYALGSLDDQIGEDR